MKGANNNEESHSRPMCPAMTARWGVGVVLASIVLLVGLDEHLWPMHMALLVEETAGVAEELEIRGIAPPQWTVQNISRRRGECEATHVCFTPQCEHCFSVCWGFWEALGSDCSLVVGEDAS